MPRTILLVDDDALMRRSLAFHLEQAGYQVQTVANAEDALALVLHAPPDLVMLDIGLPGMDGLDALRNLKAQHDFPVIFLTALGKIVAAGSRIATKYFPASVMTTCHLYNGAHYTEIETV